MPEIQVLYETILDKKLDRRNFPKRLFSQTDSVSLTLDTINKRLKELEIRRERLRDTGLLGKEEDVNFEMPAVVDVDKQNVLYMFMEDVDQKLEHIP